MVPGRLAQFQRPTPSATLLFPALLAVALGTGLGVVFQGPPLLTFYITYSTEYERGSTT